jgi:very-short-patch-repair endonuclease
MPRLAPDQPRSMTGIHRRLLAAVNACGFHTEVEEPFGPYAVDIYVPEIKMAFEADGPMHSKRRDAQRDAVLLAEYGVRVERFKQRVIQGSSLDVLARMVRLRIEEAEIDP